MDSKYLKETVGEPLSRALSEMVLMKPQDPIQYIGLWLLKYLENEENNDKSQLKLCQGKSSRKITTISEEIQNEPSSEPIPVVENVNLQHDIVEYKITEELNDVIANEQATVQQVHEDNKEDHYEIKSDLPISEDTSQLQTDTINSNQVSDDADIAGSKRKLTSEEEVITSLTAAADNQEEINKSSTSPIDMTPDHIDPQPENID